MTEEDRPLYMIGIAAKLVGIHPQTLRMYERKKLVIPQRTARDTRLYSQQDIEVLQYIQELTQEYRVNLAGVKIIIDLERTLRQLGKTVASLEKDLGKMEKRMRKEVNRVHKQYRRDLVLFDGGKLAKRMR